MSSPILTRRTAIASTTMAVAVRLLTSSNALSSPRGIEAELKELEARSGGRLGVAVLDSATGQIMGKCQAMEWKRRFAMPLAVMAAISGRRGKS